MCPLFGKMQVDFDSIQRLNLKFSQIKLDIANSIKIKIYIYSHSIYTVNPQFLWRLKHDLSYLNSSHKLTMHRCIVATYIKYNVSIYAVYTYSHINTMSN